MTMQNEYVMQPVTTEPPGSDQDDQNDGRTGNREGRQRLMWGCLLILFLSLFAVLGLAWGIERIVNSRCFLNPECHLDDGMEKQRHGIWGLQMLSPQWSADGTVIMFNTLSANAPYATQLNLLPVGTFDAALSPEGSRAAYAVGSYLGSSSVSESIRISALDGTDRREIAESDGNWRDSFFSLTWSPDGNRVAYARQDGIHTIATDGSDAHWLFPIVENPDKLVALQHHAGPVWSPDGEALAFVLEERALGDLPEGSSWPARHLLYVVSADGSSTRQVFSTNAHDIFNPDAYDVIGWPSWSPDGRELAFMRRVGLDLNSGPNDNGIDLPVGLTPYLVSRDGSKLRQLSVTYPVGHWGSYSGPFRSDFPHPVWSPDGTKLLFAIAEDQDIYVVDVDSDNSSLVGNGRYVSWSPSGDRIAVADPNGGVDYLWTIATDGSDKRVLVRVDDEGELVAVNAKQPPPWYRFWD